jgi:EmrB/QacA subfamily drug resistance transporter
MSQPTAPAVAPDPGDIVRNRRQFVWTFVGLMLAMLLAALDQTIVATALPTIVGELNGLEHLSWVVTAYLLASTIGLPIYGKAGDLFGRKPVFLFAITVFLVGSALSGAAQSMGELIAFRALQGIGGGGLMIGAQAIIGDIVPPRQRGRYMGVMGGVFGLASIAGPLIGGYLTDNVGWRWVFYINLPLGIAALATIIVTLHLHKPTGERPTLDFAGTGLLALFSTAAVLATSWGGNQYAWASPQIFALGAVIVVTGVLFVLAERRAVSPIVPLALFRERNFVFPAAAGVTIGISMFATVAYLPTYLQMVERVNATDSGLMMIPMVVGMLISSITTGRLISRTGRYRIYPVLGSTITVVALVLLSRIGIGTAYWQLAATMVLLGLGVGASMQNLTLIVQNSVPHAVLGTATSAQNYFRQIGASLGIAIFGSLFVTRLTTTLASGPLAGQSLGSGGVSSLTPAVLAGLPANVQAVIADAFATALPPIYLFAAPIAAAGIVLAAFIQERPLADTTHATGVATQAVNDPTELVDSAV